MGFTCATAAAGLHDSEVAWIPLAILAAASFLAAGATHWRGGKARPNALPADVPEHDQVGAKRDRPTPTDRSQAIPDSLALQLRREAHGLADLRGRLKSDRLGRSVLGPPPEYRSELDQAVHRISVLLERDREPWAHEFLEEIPQKGWLVLIGGEHEADRIHRHAGVYLERLNQILGRLMTEARAEHGSRPVHRVQLLREAYKKGAKLRTSLVWGEGATRNREEAQEAARRARDKAREWGQETWEMLLEHFPGHHEREFYGPENAALGKTGFWLNANEEMKRSSPDIFIDAKLTILSALLDRVDR